MKHFSGLAAAVAAIIVCAVAAVPVRAQELPPVVEALYGTLAELGGERPTHGGLTVDGDGSITISGLKAVLANFQQDGEDVRYEVGAAVVTLKGIQDLGDGAFEVAEATYEDLTAEITTPELAVVRLTAPSIQATGLVVHTLEANATALERWMAQQFFARSAAASIVTIRFGEFEVNAHDLAMTWSGDPKTGLGNWTQSLGRIDVPQEVLAHPEVAPVMQQLGYESISLSAQSRSHTKMVDELLDVGGDLSTSLKDMANLKLGLALGGLQPQLFETLQALQEAPNAIDTNALMAMAQTISISHLLLRIEDASLTGKLLTFAEKESGKARDDLIREATVTADYGLLGLNSPELNEQVKKAIDTFLRDPGFIQIEFRPETPVTVEQVMAMLGTPGEVVKLLNISVTAGPN